MGKHKIHKTGVYVRLSQEDARAGESMSIENQKLLLTKYVKEQGWELVEIYSDDGFTGTNQKRPALQRMLADVRQGIINTVLIKDLSRLGRNYLEVGNLAEIILPQHGCELISLNEKLDDMMVFRNWFNEQHSKETSKKVRAIRRMCAQNGKFLGTYAPYGFMKDPENRHHLVPDEQTAPTVRMIFELRAQGRGFRAIAILLNERGVLPPRDYYYHARGAENPNKVNHLWNENTLKVILRNEAYIGNMVQLKVGTVSYKDHRTVRKPKEEWIRYDGTHEPLISAELWERAQAIEKRRYIPRKRNDGTTSIFTGLVYCADCGFKMRNQNERRTKKDGTEHRYSAFLCGNYARSGKGACTTHTINENDLRGLVIAHIRKCARMVEQDERRIVAEILSRRNREAVSSRAAYTGELKSHRDRLSMLDKLIAKLYEDRISGSVPETVFHSLIQKYEQERVSRTQAEEHLENRIAAIREEADGAGTWVKLIRRFGRLESLTAETLLILVDKIIVSEAQTVGGKRVRDVEIVYNYVGNVDWLEETGGAERTVAAYGQAV